jgi:mannose-6-phosphate isomerase-like protein (cupin superfamily)
MEAIFRGAFKKAGAELGVESFGINVIEMPPNIGERYPEHTHEHDGQEEVYVVLKGSGRMVADGEAIALGPETFVRCGPSATRKVFSGEHGLRLLVVGGVPGAPYQRPDVFAKGTSDPTA